MSDAAPAASLEPPLHPFTVSRRIVAEALGTALLLCVMIGSGIMGERLAEGNVALALLGNTRSTGSALVVLITVFGPVSGTHFNPAVTLASPCAGRSAAASRSPMSPRRVQVPSWASGRLT